MKTASNLRQFAMNALESAKTNLSRDNYLIPVGFIVLENEVLDFRLSFENAADKRSAYSELVRIAKEKHAHAIITINDARVSEPIASNRREKPPSARDRLGKPPSDCIYVTVSGPAIRTWSLCVPYERLGGKILFDEESETFDDFLNLLSGWPKEFQQVE